VVSVTYDNRSDDARRFFEENGGDWPVVDDPENSIGVAYGVARVPESFLVSPSGIVVERLVGGVTAAQLTDLINQYEQAPG
jgi:cytochrome c biogenesis protein CcmG/thiol:disulfide interchange protein DsbE